jgi:hypothetical protein
MAKVRADMKIFLLKHAVRWIGLAGSLGGCVQSIPVARGTVLSVQELVLASRQQRARLVVDGDRYLDPQSRVGVEFSGCVRHPGVIALSPGELLPLRKGIQTSGGLARLADPNRIQIVRPARQQLEIFWVALGSRGRASIRPS